jgi:hypothetical protein
MNETSDDSTITFTGEYQFSIRCGKCADIHNAQLEGKGTKPCECDCHAKIAEPYVPYTPYIPCTPCPCPQYPYFYTTTGTKTLPNTTGTICEVHK